MTIPDWLKPALYGAATGAVALALLGFTTLGWTTAATATQAARAEAKAAVIAALTPICVDMATTDLAASTALNDVRAASTWARRDLVIAAGWATMPGAAEADRDVASACGAALNAAP